jgi:hypothetical protein
MNRKTSLSRNARAGIETARVAPLLIFVFILILISCAGTPPHRPKPPATAVMQPERVVPEAPERVLPLPPEYIMGKGQIPQEKLIDFVLSHNPWAEPDFVSNLADYYVIEARAEGVNYDIAFVQMCLETGFLSYGGLVTADMNNFCGLGSTGLPDTNGVPERGLAFPDPQTGVRAHIQHLKAYATSDTLNQDVADPRYRYVRKGSAPTIHGLAGTWATDIAYAAKLGVIMQRLYTFSFLAQ